MRVLGCAVVVDVSLFAVLPLLLALIIIMAMGKRCMVVLVCMPGCPVLPFPKHAILMVV